MSEEKDKQGCFLISAAVSLVAVLIVNLVSSAIPFGFWEFWHLPKGGFWASFWSFWPLLLWGFAAPIALHVLGISSVSWEDNPKDLVQSSIPLSIWAGVSEEISFRWLIFMASIVTAKIGNWLVFGCLGFGVAEWTYTHIVGVIADWATLGWMSGVLFHPYGWAVGAAVIATNTVFRDGHAYQGFLGWVNSWFLGMVFFYATFEHGLPLAIFLHFAYDVIVINAHAMMVKIRQG